MPTTLDFLKGRVLPNTKPDSEKKSWNYERDKVRPLYLEAAKAIDSLVATFTDDQWKAISILLNQDPPQLEGEFSQKAKRLFLTRLIYHGDLYNHREAIALHGMKNENNPDSK